MIIYRERGNLLVAHQDVIGNYIFILERMINESYNKNICNNLIKGNQNNYFFFWFFSTDRSNLNMSSYSFEEIEKLFPEHIQNIIESSYKYGNNKVSFHHSSIFRGKGSKNASVGEVEK